MSSPLHIDLGPGQDLRQRIMIVIILVKSHISQKTDI